MPGLNRRSFLKHLFGGGTAALVGATVPAGLRSDEIALLEERVDFDFHDGTLANSGASKVQPP